METKEKKRKVGRPKKANKYDHLLRVRISKEKQKKLQKIAEKTKGKTVSSVVRELIESAPEASRLPSLDEWNKWTPKEKADWHKKMLKADPEQESKNSAPLFKLANRIPLIEAEEKRKKRTWLPD